MNRVIAVIFYLALLAPSTGQSQLSDDFFDVELKVVPVAGRVHMIQRADGFANVGVFVGDEGVLLVDSQFEPHAQDLVQAVHTLTDGDIRFLVNTHVHPDHLGGNAPLAADGVLIFAHDNMRVRMLESRSRFPRGNGGFFELGRIHFSQSLETLDVYLSRFFAAFDTFGNIVFFRIIQGVKNLLAHIYPE